MDMLEPEENLKFCRVKDVSTKQSLSEDQNETNNLIHIYELGKAEKRIISFYRILPEEQKQIIADYITQKVLEFFEKDRAKQKDI
jgi:hypothetical protein